MESLIAGLVISQMKKDAQIHEDALMNTYIIEEHCLKIHLFGSTTTCLFLSLY